MVGIRCGQDEILWQNYSRKLIPFIIVHPAFKLLWNFFYEFLFEQQDESTQRYQEGLKHIREKAFEMSVLRHSTEDHNDAPEITPYDKKKMCTICNALVNDKLEIFFYYTPPHKKWRGIMLYLPKILSVHPYISPSVHQHFVSGLCNVWPIFFKLCIDIDNGGKGFGIANGIYSFINNRGMALDWDKNVISGL